MVQRTKREKEKKSLRQLGNGVTVLNTVWQRNKKKERDEASQAMERDLPVSLIPIAIAFSLSFLSGRP